jgi:hypothetical protein
MSELDYRMVRDRCRRASACTIRTTLAACRRSDDEVLRKDDGSSGGDNDDGDSSDDDGGGDVIEPRRSIQTSKSKLLQP